MRPIRIPLKTASSVTLDSGTDVSCLTNEITQEDTQPDSRRPHQRHTTRGLRTAFVSPLHLMRPDTPYRNIYFNLKNSDVFITAHKSPEVCHPWMVTCNYVIRTITMTASFSKCNMLYFRLADPGFRAV